MKRRQPITAETLSRVAAENAGHPLDGERAAGYAESFESILQLLDGLRALPLKEIEPAIIFRPEGAPDHD